MGNARCLLAGTVAELARSAGAGRVILPDEKVKQGLGRVGATRTVASAQLLDGTVPASTLAGRAVVIDSPERAAARASLLGALAPGASWTSALRSRPAPMGGPSAWRQWASCSPSASRSSSRARGPLCARSLGAGRDLVAVRSISRADRCASAQI